MLREETMVNESPVTVNFLIATAIDRAVVIQDSCSSNETVEDIAISLLKAAIKQLRK